MTESEPNPDDRLLDLIGLTMVPGVGPQTTRALLDHFGTAGRVLSASRAELREVANVGPKLAEKIAKARQEFDAEAELALCRRLGVEVIPRDNPKYPPPLQNIPDPPGLIYWKGRLESRRPARHRDHRLAPVYALRGPDRGAAGRRVVADRFHDRLRAGAGSTRRRTEGRSRPAGAASP